jgi:glycosyltransferase involved in cell wall biosynthesis
LKIAFVDEDLSPRTGSRRFTYEVTRQLQNRGHEVKVFTTKLDEEKCFREFLSMSVEVISGRKSAKKNSSKIRYVNLGKNAFLEMANNFAYWSKQARLALRISEEVVDAQCELTLFQYHGEHWLLPYFYYLGKPNGAIYLNVVPPMPGSSALPFQELTLRGRVVDSLISLSPIGEWEKLSFRKVSLFITPSGFQLKQAQQQGLIGHKKTAVVPLGVDHSEFYPADEEEKFALYVGRIHPHKSLELAVMSMKDAPSDSRLIIAGDIENKYLWYKEKLKELAEEMNVSGFELILFPSDSRVIQLMQKCSIFLFPSTIDTFGLVALEAMACGKPVVACDRGGVPEIIGDAGFLLEPDVGQWRTTVSRLFSDSSLRRQMGKRALERSKIFSWERTTETLLSSFSQILV